MKVLIHETSIALRLTIDVNTFCLRWVQEFQIIWVFSYFACFPYYNTEMEERSIHSNNGKIFQSHKLYFWQFPIKWPFNSTATTLRNGRLSQWCYSRAKDKSAGRTRIWSHYTSECVNEYDTDTLVLFMCTFKGTVGLEAWWVVVFVWQLWHVLPCHLLMRLGSAATSWISVLSLQVQVLFKKKIVTAETGKILIILIL